MSRTDVESVDTVIIGAGQAGLATSYHLTAQQRSHVLLDRAWAGSRWETDRWDSLRLLTPNWMSRLPGWHYTGPDPDGYLRAPEVAEYLRSYAASFGAPVHEGAQVVAVEPTEAGHVVRTPDRSWLAASVVVATGYCDIPAVPAAAAGLPPSVAHVTPSDYTSPEALPAGAVLVVGASASGVQIAHELRTAGRDVVLAVGRHTRVPRDYRGMDIMWWLDTIGMLDRSIDEVSDKRRFLREPSLQVVGRPSRENVDLARLHELGVRLAGRLLDADGTVVRFAEDLPDTTADADYRLGRVLDQVDAFAEQAGLSGEVLEPHRPAPFRPPAHRTRLDVAASGIAAVVWATGYQRSYCWLQAPVLNRHGEIVQRAGITDRPGVYTVGQRFQSRRSSSSIDGVRHDAAAVAAHINALRPVRRHSSALSWSRP